RELEGAEHRRGAMLQRLEGADGDAELLPLLQILQRALEGFRRRAEHLRGKPDAGAVEQGLEEVGAAMDRPEYGVFADLGALEADDRGVAAVDHEGATARDARRVTRHEKERDAVALARFAGAARGDDEKIGDMAIEHEALLAIEAEARAAARG